MIELKRTPQRKIQRANADRFQRIRERRKPLLTEALAPQDQSDASDESHGDSPCGTDPTSIECILDEVRNTDEKSENADAVEPDLSNLAFEVGLFAFYGDSSRLSLQRRWGDALFSRCRQIVNR